MITTSARDWKVGDMGRVTIGPLQNHTVIIDQIVGRYLIGIGRNFGSIVLIPAYGEVEPVDFD